MGTTFRDLIARAGGATIADYGVFISGLMMGTLTFDLGFHNAHTAGYTAAQAAEVADYIKYEVSPTEGQHDLIGTWYSALPSNVQEAATTAASKLG